MPMIREKVLIFKMLLAICQKIVRVPASFAVVPLGCALCMAPEPTRVRIFQSARRHRCSALRFCCMALKPNGIGIIQCARRLCCNALKLCCVALRLHVLVSVIGMLVMCCFMSKSFPSPSVRRQRISRYP